MILGIFSNIFLLKLLLKIATILYAPNHVLHIVSLLYLKLVSCHLEVFEIYKLSEIFQKTNYHTWWGEYDHQPHFSTNFFLNPSNPMQQTRLQDMFFGWEFAQ